MWQPLLELMEVDSSFFDETMNELNNTFWKFNDSLHELEDVNIENVLDRIENYQHYKKIWLYRRVLKI